MDILPIFLNKKLLSLLKMVAACADFAQDFLNVEKNGRK